MEIMSKGIVYIVKSPTNCDYSDAMQKVYCKPPEVTEQRCKGYHNKYTGRTSRVCAQCCFLSAGKGE